MPDFEMRAGKEGVGRGDSKPQAKSQSLCLWTGRPTQDWPPDPSC